MGPNSSAQSKSSLREILRERYFLWVVLFITAATYLGTLRFDFVYDDYAQILYNPFVKSWKYVPQYFVSSVWKQMSSVERGNYYRPLFLVWTRLNYALFFNRPLGWHIGAVLLHLVVTWLVYWVIRKMTGQSGLAWMTALLFGVHPIHHEVVAWVSGATESLFAVFFLAAFLAYLRAREAAKTSWMALSCVLYALALLCKETAIVFPALVFAHGWIADGPEEEGNASGSPHRWGRSIRATLLYVPIVLIYLAARYKALAGFSHPTQKETLWQWLLTLPSLLFFYVKHWVLPIGLSESYDVYFQTQFNFGQVVLPALILVAMGVAVWLIRKCLGSREVGYAVAWIVIPLLPALDTFVFRADELVHDRYFYIPSIGAALLIALIIERAVKTTVTAFGQPVHVLVTGLVLAIVLALGTARATSFWKDDFTLYSRGHEIAPSNSTATVNLGAELIDRKEIDTAQTLLEAGYRKNSGDFRFAFDLGKVHYNKRQYPLAEQYIRQVISIAPIFPDAYVYLSQIELQEGRPAEAQKNMRLAVVLEPDSPAFRTSYGIVLEVNGDCADAMTQFQAALALNPGDAITQREMFRCRKSLGSANDPGTKSSRR